MHSSISCGPSSNVSNRISNCLIPNSTLIIVVDPARTLLVRGNKHSKFQRCLGSTQWADQCPCRFRRLCLFPCLNRVTWSAAFDVCFRIPCWSFSRFLLGSLLSRSHLGITHGFGPVATAHCPTKATGITPLAMSASRKSEDVGVGLKSRQADQTLCFRRCRVRKDGSERPSSLLRLYRRWCAGRSG